MDIKRGDFGPVTPSCLSQCGSPQFNAVHRASWRVVCGSACSDLIASIALPHIRLRGLFLVVVFCPGTNAGVAPDVAVGLDPVEEGVGVDLPDAPEQYVGRVLID
jgi:hypothetical protein